MEMTPEGLDALKEAINIGVGYAASSLNQLFDTHISLDVPAIELTTPELLVRQGFMAGKDISCVTLSFGGRLDGSASLIFPPQDAAKLVTLLMDDNTDTDDLDALRSGTLEEIGNIVINGIMGTISNLLGSKLDFELPTYLEGSPKELYTAGILHQNQAVLLVKARFRLEKLQTVGTIILLFELSSLDALLTAFVNMYDE